MAEGAAAAVAPLAPVTAPHDGAPEAADAADVGAPVDAVAPHGDTGGCVAGGVVGAATAPNGDPTGVRPGATGAAVEPNDGAAVGAGAERPKDAAADCDGVEPVPPNDGAADVCPNEGAAEVWPNVGAAEPCPYDAPAPEGAELAAGRGNAVGDGGVGGWATGVRADVRVGTPGAGRAGVAGTGSWIAERCTGVRRPVSSRPRTPPVEAGGRTTAGAVGWGAAGACRLRREGGAGCDAGAAGIGAGAPAAAAARACAAASSRSRISRRVSGRPG
jgi:hypothetical protein